MFFWNAIERKAYSGPEAAENETRRAFISDDNKLGYNLKRSVKESGIPVAFSVPNKQGKLSANMNKSAKQ